MKQFGNVLWGFVFIGVGLIWGLNVLGFTKIDLFFNGWWTLFIIIPCFIGLFQEKEKTGNCIGLGIGVILLLCCQNILNFTMVWKLLIPIILIAVGISFFGKNVISNKFNQEVKKIKESNQKTNEYCATFAGQNINFDHQEFKGAELTAVFGGIKCDLRQATFTKDQVIQSTAIFGGVEIYVPAGIQVRIKSTPIFGGVSDKTIQNNKEQMPILYVNATCVFGGVEIK